MAVARNINVAVVQSTNPSPWRLPEKLSLITEVRVLYDLSGV